LGINFLCRRTPAVTGPADEIKPLKKRLIAGSGARHGSPLCSGTDRNHIGQRHLYHIEHSMQLRCNALILIMSLPERANRSNTVDTVILKVGKLPTD
jgi:hypothetical protein